MTSSNDEGHVPLLTVQRNVFAPGASPVTLEAGFDGDVTVPVPPTSVHTPLPTEGVLPASSVDEPLISGSGPATAVVGGASRVIMTVSFEGEQEPFPTVQTNSLTPTERPVT